MQLNKGLSFIIRAKNEEENIERCITTISDIATEIIFVDNNSTDNTLKIARRLARKFDNLKVFTYKKTIPKCGAEQKKAVGSDNTIATYYNWCLSKATCKNIIKWDGDFVANRENLKQMIKKFKLDTRDDKFKLWFAGETVFVSDKNYINNRSYYDEYRCFSKKHGFKWVDSTNWEAPDMDYINDSKELRFDLPVFYEIKRVDKDEFTGRTNSKALDNRDLLDQGLLKELKKGKVSPRFLEEVDDDFKRRKHFLIYPEWIPRVGGIETAVYELAKALGKKGYKVTIAYKGAESQYRLFHYSKVADIRRVQDGDPEIKCDTCLVANMYKIPPQIKAKKYLQWIHSDYQKYNCGWKPNPEVSQYISVSKYTGKVAEKLYDIKTIPIYNYLDPEWSNYNPIRFITVSRISKEKGFDRILKFVERLEKEKIEYIWDIYGDNTLYPSIENEYKCAFRHYPTVRFNGFIDDVRSGLQVADFIVMLSDYEGCPFCLVEAFQFGVPAIVTNWGGVEELVKEGKNGYILPMDLKITREKFLKIVKNPPKFKPFNLGNIEQWEKII
jgi:glycosyltransferase involved in cell wall biosynthesis